MQHTSHDDKRRGLWSSKKRGNTLPTSPTATPTPSLDRRPTDVLYKPGRGPTKGSKLYLEYVSGYNLMWPDLLAWLRRHFQEKGLECVDQTGRDWFEIYLPRRLAEDEKRAIDALRRPTYEEPEEVYEPDPPLSP